ncbi:MAG: hypothetical protein VW715_07235 [Rhodospirillales bacterium]
MSRAYSRRPNPFKKPPKKVIEELEKVEEAMLEEEEEEWETFFTSNDRSTPSRLFDNPPERFLARLDYGDTVACYLLEDNPEEGYLAYACNTGSLWNIVYIYRGRCAHQHHMIRSVYLRNDVDWRVVPITDRNSRSIESRSRGIDWAVWVFCHYFAFDLFPE